MGVGCAVSRGEARLGREHGSPVCRAERKLIEASTVEPDPDHAGAGRHLRARPHPRSPTRATLAATGRGKARIMTTSSIVHASIWRWRVVDIVTAAVLGVASGVLFWAWGLAWTPLSTLLAFSPGLSGLLAGGWLFAGILGGLV